MGVGGSSRIVRYLAGNYSVANLQHTLAVVDILSNIPGGVWLVTELGVGVKVRRVLGLLEHGTIRPSGLGDHSFYSFSEDHLNVFRIENPSNKIEGMSEFSINISAQILTPEQPSRILLRTPWEAIFEMIQRDPDAIYKFTKDPRSFEEFIADTYRLDGYSVELTPRSNDGGVDVIATKDDFGAIKIVDQAKAYAAHRKVTANDVRAAYDVLGMRQDASEVVITTTSDFAPGVYEEFATFMPSRLDLRHGQGLIQWLKEVSNRLP